MKTLLTVLAVIGGLAIIGVLAMSFGCCGMIGSGSMMNDMMGGMMGGGMLVMLLVAVLLIAVIVALTLFIVRRK